MNSSGKDPALISDCEDPSKVRGVRRAIYITLAVFFLAVGLVGVVLPGIPTTPFLLLMSYFLIRSSPWLHRRVVQLPIVGGPIRDWRQQRGVRRHIKIIAFAMVIAVVAASLTSTATNVPIKVVTASLASIGMFVIWRLPTIN